MNITKENIDALNAVVKIEINADDYQSKVEEVLKDYRKKADTPGFRKGQVPMGMIKKQYGKSVLIDEVNKLIQESLNNFLAEEKLDILGNPLPKMQDDFSWDTESYSFEFELGLAPTFEVKLDDKKKVTQYNIVADEDLINKEVENLQKRFGTLVAKDEVAEGMTVTGTFVNEEKELENKATIELVDLEGEANLSKFVGAKVGDVLVLNTKNLFADDHKLMSALGMTHDDIHGLEIDLTFTIEEVQEMDLAEVNQELFDKIFGPDIVSSIEELKTKIKEDAEKQFETQGDQQLLNAVTEHLVENTKFELPSAFLKKWLTVAGENPISEEKASEEFVKSEKGLRYQLIEGKLMKEHDIKLSFEELKDYTKGFVKAQMAQYGQTNPEEKELDDIAQRVLSNQDEAKRLQEQMMSQKLLSFYKEKMTFKVKEVSYDEFVKEVYK